MFSWCHKMIYASFSNSGQDTLPLYLRFFQVCLVKEELVFSGSSSIILGHDLLFETIRLLLLLSNFLLLHFKLYKAMCLFMHRLVILSINCLLSFNQCLRVLLQERCRTSAFSKLINGIWSSSGMCINAIGSLLL